MPTNLENLSVATGLEKVSFHHNPPPKKGNAKECSNYLTILLTSHTSEVMLKILQARLQQFHELFMNHELPDVQAGFRKGRGTRDQIVNIHRKTKRIPEKHLLLLYWLYQSLWLCGSQHTVENSSRDGIPNHLTWLLRNLYGGQEATVRTGHGATDWLQIGKGVHQGCILSTCLFNLYHVKFSLSWENPLVEGTATHSIILAWRIPWKRSLAGCGL